MESIENLLPKTRLYRENLRLALQSHNISIIKHKTHSYQGIFWDLCKTVGADTSSWKSYNVVRTVTFWLERNDRVNEALIRTALTDVRVWAALCGAHLVLNLDEDKDRWRIRAACVIS